MIWSVNRLFFPRLCKKIRPAADAADRILRILKMSHSVRGSQAANKMKSVFCGGVYAAKNSLRYALRHRLA